MELPEAIISELREMGIEVSEWKKNEIYVSKNFFAVDADCYAISFRGNQCILRRAYSNQFTMINKYYEIEFDMCDPSFTVVKLYAAIQSLKS